MTGIKDVAKRAGVSVATVSRVLSGKAHVKPETRALVLQAVAESRYRPSRIAGRMRSQSSPLVGLLIGDIRNPFFTAIARAIEDMTHGEDMSLFLCNTDEDAAKEDMYIETLLEERVAGVILSPTRGDASAFEQLLEGKTPVVAIDRRIAGAGIDGVYSENVMAAQTLTHHLIDQGYRRIGAIFGLKDSMTGRERMAGFLAGLSSRGLEAEPEFARFTRPLEGDGETVVRDWLSGPNRPDAILTGNSRLTIGALDAIAAAGLSIPNDVGLAGFDETAWMRHAGPGITVISQPTYEIGRTAAELLFQRMADPERPTREVVLEGSLIVRGSTAKR